MTEPAVTHASAVELIRESIERIAPDVDASALPSDADVRVEAELDSMDFIALLSTITERTGIDVPESEVAAAHTIDGFADYLVKRTNGLGTGAST